VRGRLERLTRARMLLRLRVRCAGACGDEQKRERKALAERATYVRERSVHDVSSWNESCFFPQANCKAR